MKIHMNDKYNSKNSTRVYYGCNSLFRESTDKFSLVTCRVCKGLYEIDKGKIDYLPFGGSLDKNGKERLNDGHKGKK